MTSNVKISIKDGDKKVKIGIVDGKMKIKSVESYNNEEIDMNAINQLIKEVGSILKEEKEDKSSSKISVKRPLPEEVEKKIKEEAQSIKKAIDNDKSKNNSVSIDKTKFYDELVDDFCRYLFKYMWENVSYSTDECILNAYLGSDITMTAEFWLDKDALQITFSINTASTSSDTTFKIGTGFKKKRNANVFINSSGKVLTLDYSKTDIDYTKETYDSIISDFKKLLKDISEEKENLLGLGIIRDKISSDPYIPRERPRRSSSFPYGMDMVCYYGCPNSNKVAALQTTKKNKCKKEENLK